MIPRKIFTRRRSMWERVGEIHPAAQACAFLLGLAAACALAEFLCGIAGVPLHVQ